MIQLIGEHDCRVAGVIEQRAMGTDHPIYYFPTVNVQRRSRFAVWKRRDHGRRAQQDIPLLEELLPGEHGLVTPVKGFQVLGEGSRWFVRFRLECSSNHAN